MGNYSRFIRPGFVRLETQGSTETLKVSAYRSADDRRWVLVAVNQAGHPVTIQLSAINGQLPGQTEQFETSEQHNLEAVGSGSAQEAWTLAPMSVTTLVLDR
jgi:O-glycosyl hydrolase